MIQHASRYIRLFLKGMAMGAADIVPGVSGGTIAFISGIYEELIDSLRSLDWSAVRVLFRDGIPAAWRHVNGNFLLTLFLGLLTSALTLANVVLYCFEHYPILIWAFFFGLVLASSIYLARRLGRWSWVELVLLVTGLVAAWLIAEIKPAQLPDHWWVIALAGSVAICAMILPGISGGFILLVLGLWTTVIEGILSLNWVLIISFGFGCAAGLLSFSHLLSWLLHRFHSATLALLTGFLFGSLNVIWPWKQTLETTVNRHGETVVLVSENIWPQQYSEQSGQDSYLLFAIALAVLGAILVLILEISAAKTESSTLSNQ